MINILCVILLSPSILGFEFIFDHHNDKKKQETIYAIQCTVIQLDTEFDMIRTKINYFFHFLKSGLSKNILNSTKKNK